MRKILLPFVLLILAVMGCSKDVIDYMEGFYVESQGLNSVTIDSVTTFAKKVDNYVSVFPEEKEHPLYPKVQENILNAQLRITIIFPDTTWAVYKKLNY